MTVNDPRTEFSLPLLALPPAMTNSAPSVRACQAQSPKTSQGSTDANIPFHPHPTRMAPRPFVAALAAPLTLSLALLFNHQQTSVSSFSYPGIFGSGSSPL